MFNVSEGNMSPCLSDFCFIKKKMQLVSIIGSRELQGRVAKVGVGFGDDH
jgi:hypothetical protein